jgi:diguanylate cyclase (GGDEF)-like protein
MTRLRDLPRTSVTLSRVAQGVSSFAFAAAGQPDGEVVALRIIDDVVAAEAELVRRAKYDDLTGALKRDGALEHLEAMSGRGEEQGKDAAVVFVDLDDFKTVNDQHGHAAGDAVLCAIADRIRSAVPTDNLIARMGGDEFLVILNGLRNLDEAARIANRICSKAREPIEVPGGSARVTLSIGVTLRCGNEDPDRLIARADHAMYQAKNAGRDRVVAIPAPTGSG